MSSVNKVAIVTGGGRGIGRAIVTKLLSQNFDIVTCGRGPRPQDLDGNVAWVEADVRNIGDVARLASIAVSRGTLAAVVNNAGVQIEKTVVDTTDQDWDFVVGINCRGLFNVCREVLPKMLDDGGSIINIGSIAGDISEPSMALYNASKAFVHSLTRSIAIDHGPTVRCNAVCPGWILTELTDAAFALSKDPEAARTDAVARHASRRFGTPSDVANMVSWLVSPESEFVTGQCFTIDGGLTAASPIRPNFF